MAKTDGEDIVARLRKVSTYALMDGARAVVLEAAETIVELRKDAASLATAVDSLTGATGRLSRAARVYRVDVVLAAIRSATEKILDERKEDER